VASTFVVILVLWTRGFVAIFENAVFTLTREASGHLFEALRRAWLGRAFRFFIPPLTGATAPPWSPAPLVIVFFIPLDAPHACEVECPRDNFLLGTAPSEPRAPGFVMLKEFDSASSSQWFYWPGRRLIAFFSVTRRAHARLPKLFPKTFELSALCGVQEGDIFPVTWAPSLGRFP